LHKKFIDECYNWLEAAMIPLEGSMVSHTLLQATKLLTSMCVPQGSILPSPSRFVLFYCSGDLHVSRICESLVKVVYLQSYAVHCYPKYCLSIKGTV